MLVIRLLYLYCVIVLVCRNTPVCFYLLENLLYYEIFLHVIYVYIIKKCELVKKKKLRYFSRGNYTVDHDTCLF